ncbi:hypothetical protein DICPUDRAFT_88035 [Dictyostelium purpureum]|uniref:DNA alkylation repair enzyme n=1 Tax=Dictyostelium purpureum TaxID=5786 RepID=F0ZLX7_DICPU|nr:uncharacterized protein DICPUDRAFT_88035 [Dictyostelium purpureum]EGC35044.1 hypothetical protein DICPUDRAFT_88035 [Dictyostelium purpureum]|eukprot:XP_003288412.1 hypothetical protein DICPUDRAFT_88035 [Dictyostelium purpureum]
MSITKQSKYVGNLVKHFKSNRNIKLGTRMEQYMRSQFTFLGIQSPQRKDLLKSFIADHGRPSNDQEIMEIYKQKEREFKYVAIELAAHQIKKTSDENRIKVYEEMASIEPFWDTIDIIGSKLVGGHFKLFPDQIKEYTTDKWANSDCFWKKRICIIFQLTYKKEVDIDLLFSFIEPNIYEKEFFLQKACAWALRSLSKTHHNVVFDYMQSHQDVSNMVKREASKYLHKKKIKD